VVPTGRTQSAAASGGRPGGTLDLVWVWVWVWVWVRVWVRVRVRVRVRLRVRFGQVRLGFGLETVLALA